MELALTGVVAAAMIATSIAARRLGRKDDAAMMVVIAIVFVGAIWISPTIRSIAIGSIVVVIAWSVSALVGVIFALVAVAAAVWLPGGVSVVLLAVVALWGQSEVRAAREHLQRLARAKTLVANDPVTAEVELTGRVRAVGGLVDPLHGKPCAHWHVYGDGGSRESSALIEIRGETGSALIDPATVRMEWSGNPEEIPESRLADVGKAVRLELGESKPLYLRMLPEGTECYVVGWPTWETSPADGVGLYRDAPVLPVFRSTPEHPAFFADRTETALRLDHTFAMIAWGTWTLVCATIVVAQLAGWAS